MRRIMLRISKSTVKLTQDGRIPADAYKDMDEPKHEAGSRPDKKVYYAVRRYHKDVYIPEADKVRLEALTADLNGKKWTYTGHCTDNLKMRYIGLTEVLLFIKGLTLHASDIFEYYDEAGRITKLCYRVKYTAGIDIILILSDVKNIITIYTNTSDDDHVTLDRTLYVKN